MKGFNFDDWNHSDTLRSPPLFGSPDSDLRLKKLADIGPNWIALVFSFFQETLASTEVIKKQYATASDQSLENMIKLAHTLGMRVMLKPNIQFQDWTHFNHTQIGTAFTTEEQWQAWFSSYRQIVVYYATFAEKTGADMLCIGDELCNTSQRETDWRRIIQEVRQVYKGPIIYEALTAIVTPLPTDEYLQIKWWDAVDYIGVLGYFPLTQSNNPTVEELKSAWVNRGYLSRLEGLSQKFQRPIVISEIGYGSVDGTNIFPLNYLKFAELPLDLQEQADCYQATFEVLSGKPWLKGIFWWDWPAIFGGFLTAKEYTPLGKPAEEIIKQFYLSH